MTKQGKVYLIGAGPGDPGLLSIKAMECLKAADAVVYDRLADPRILAYARPDAEMVYVGKASANHTMRQPDINKLLVKLAAEGKTVARLKGGDPFEFVPGVTSAIAVAEYAGIPVTHRRVATSFAVITGHEDPTKGESTINWQGLATAVDTLVFLMGVENIPKITQKLIENGRSADTPAAVIRWGTHPEQQTLVTTVGTAAADVAAAGLKPPAIFIVGNVVKLREQLRWYDNALRPAPLPNSWKLKEQRLSKRLPLKLCRPKPTPRLTKQLKTFIPINGWYLPAPTALKPSLHALPMQGLMPALWQA